MSNIGGVLGGTGLSMAFAINVPAPWRATPHTTAIPITSTPLCGRLPGRRPTWAPSAAIKVGPWASTPMGTWRAGRRQRRHRNLTLSRRHGRQRLQRHDRPGDTNRLTSTAMHLASMTSMWWSAALTAIMASLTMPLSGPTAACQAFRRGARPEHAGRLAAPVGLGTDTRIGHQRREPDRRHGDL